MRDINAMSRDIDWDDSVDASALSMSPPVKDTSLIDGKPGCDTIISHQPPLPENGSAADQWRGKAVNGMLSFHSNIAKGIAPIAATSIRSLTHGYVAVEWAKFLVATISSATDAVVKKRMSSKRIEFVLGLSGGTG